MDISDYTRHHAVDISDYIRHQWSQVCISDYIRHHSGLYTHHQWTKICIILVTTYITSIDSGLVCVNITMKWTHQE